MKAALITLAVTASMSSLKTAIHGHSSFLKTVKDRYLDGHVTDRLKASSILRTTLSEKNSTVPLNKLRGGGWKPDLRVKR